MAVTVRIVTKTIYVRKFELDDLLIIASTILAIAQSTAVWFSTSEGFAQSLDTLNDSQIQALSKIIDCRATTPSTCAMFGSRGIALGYLSRVLGTLTLFLSGFQNGGSAGVVYGYLLVWVGTLSVFATLSELVSMAPTSGGQYHWVSMLAPSSCAKFLSYMTSWITVGGWQATVASGGYLTGTLIQGLIALTVPEYKPKSWHRTLLFWAVIFFAIFINTVVSNLLPKFEGLILILHLLGFFAILRLDPMSEEIHNPSVVVPRSIMLSVILNGLMGFAMVIAVLFCLGDINTALSTNTGYPFMEIFLQATHSVAGSAVMAAIVTSLALFATVGILASTSRMFWSFARDRGLPGWQTLQKVGSRRSVPIWSIAVTTTISCLLALINIGSATAFNDIVSLSVVGLFTRYKIYFSVYGRSGKRPQRTLGMGPLVWGPWSLRGIFGIANNAFTCVYLTVILFFGFWPPVTPVKAATMNYSSLMLGAVLLLSVGYYVLHARKEYQGPLFETDGPILDSAT
ncbi:Choline transport protein [Lachnellula willkommii]|uniref:Choline transport protein n=1 Tax=Lachnellula willkommii TaxID=215461 RepID=A0A559MBF0_9HELO|nr:Choline transport protein [Lachnellula willkommii]